MGLQITAQENAARIAETQDLRNSLVEQNIIAVENNVVANTIVHNEALRASCAMEETVAIANSRFVAPPPMIAPPIIPQPMIAPVGHPTPVVGSTILPGAPLVHPGFAP